MASDTGSAIDFLNVAAMTHGAWAAGFGCFRLVIGNSFIAG